MIRDEKLDFWLNNGFNVLLVGKHGVGKTALVKACFERHGLTLGETFLYFSAATLDPWVDLVGVPRERTGDDGTPYLDLVQPRALATGVVQAVFFDEFNRSHKKVRNAVMELLQFKSINGKRFPNLKVVWAAINPSDEGDYDVEPIDPAQMDRFHVTVPVPYQPSLTWFTQRFGEKTARSACSWWDELPDEEKERVSPRRLEYALQMEEAGGDLRDVLPASCNVMKLRQILCSGPARERLLALFDARDVAGALLFLGHENSYASAIRTILDSDSLMGFFLPLLPKEKLAALVSSSGRACHFICERHTQYPVFQEVMRDILAANQNKKLVKRIRKALHDSTVQARRVGTLANASPAPAHFNDTPASSRPWMDLMADLKKSSLNSSGERSRVYQECVTNIPARLTAEEALATLELFDDLASRCCATAVSGHGLRLLVNMTNHCVGQIAAAQGIGWTEIVRRHGRRFNRLLEKLKDAGLSGRLFTPGRPDE